VFLALGLFQSITASAALVVASGDSVAIIPRVEILRDPSGRLTVEQVAGESGFQPLGRTFSLGFSRDAVWLRLTLARAPDVGEDWWLVASPPFIDDIRLYSPDGHGGYRERGAGDHVRVDERFLATRETVLPLVLDTTPSVHYLRVRSTSTLTLTVDLMTPAAFAERTTLENTRHGLFLGLVVTAVLITLLCAVWIRQRFFVVAAAYLLVFGLLQFTLNGYDQLLIYPDTPWLADSLVGVLAALASTLLILFALSYLEPAAHLPRFDITLRALAGLSFAAALAAALGFYPLFAPWFFLVALAILGLLSILFFLMLPYRRARALLMLVMFLPGLIAVLLQVLRNIGALPVNFWTTDLWALTMFFQVPFAAVVVLFRVEEEKKRLVIAQERESVRRGLLHMIAHEQRTPLAVAEAALANIEARTIDERPELKPRFQRAGTALARLNALVDNALAEDSLRAGEIRLDRQPVAPSQLAEQIRNLMVVDERHDMRISRAPDDRPILIDPHWLGLAVLNLLDNAIKYSPEGGAIDLSLVRDIDGLSIRVEDRGIGIPPEARDRLFERFYRANNARALPGVGGLGLGLYLAHQVVRLHGGEIRVESSLGEGTRFTLEIPETDARVTTPVLVPGT